MRNVGIAAAVALTLALLLGLGTVAIAGGTPWHGGMHAAMHGTSDDGSAVDGACVQEGHGDHHTAGGDRACEQMASHMGDGAAGEGCDDIAAEGSGAVCPQHNEHHASEAHHGSMMGGMMHH